VGLELGADDYVCKPFHLREILARAKKALRPLTLMRDAVGAVRDTAAGSMRDAAASDDCYIALCFEGWRAYPDRRQLISPNGADVPLTGGEFKLLSVFLKNPGRVLSRQHLMDVTHGTGWHAYERTIDAQISRLRKKLEADPKRPKLIKSVHGDGYVFAATVSRQVAPKN
jgi:two-component system phosphate regulon response regulator OmpR